MIFCAFEIFDGNNEKLGEFDLPISSFSDIRIIGDDELLFKYCFTNLFQVLKFKDSSVTCFELPLLGKLNMYSVGCVYPINYHLEKIIPVEWCLK